MGFAIFRAGFPEGNAVLSEGKAMFSGGGKPGFPSGAKATGTRSTARFPLEKNRSAADGERISPRQKSERPRFSL